jgi:hypothetical protein
MSGVIISLSFDGHPSQSPAHLNVSKTVWQKVAEKDKYAILLEFVDADEANLDLQSVVESDNFPENDHKNPTEVLGLTVEHRHGRVLNEVGGECFMAVWKSVVNPGFGHDARERTEEILTTFTQIGSYLGHIMGANMALEDESYALVFGTDYLELPIPYNPEVTVTIYRRVIQSDALDLELSN